MPSAVSSADLRIVEVVLRMEDGYVCNFNDRRFAEFFEDFDVDIGDPRYCEDGTSKAKRLRRFLRSEDSVWADQRCRRLGASCAGRNAGFYVARLLLLSGGS